ncbi:hypothetical protein [Anaeromyxobacter dehalogenans]|nr:hypothetical protein [Anaeromyxobacter dehalogenans]
MRPPRLARTHEGMIEPARRGGVEGAGGALLWTHARPILESLLTPRA